MWSVDASQGAGGPAGADANREPHPNFFYFFSISLSSLAMSDHLGTFVYNPEPLFLGRGGRPLSRSQP